MLNEGLIYTSDKCIGCNRCISGCPVIGANISASIRGENKIFVDYERCIHCGRCLATCRHDAREYRDDTTRFFRDLQKGEKISLLVAPSFFIIYENASQILGWLKSKGVNFIYDVSYGADIATWAYIKYVEDTGLKGAIAPPCTTVVNYLQKYSETLTKKIIPIYSPMMCLASYLRKYEGIEDRFAFLGPCIAKKDEIDDPANEGLVQYNVTFSHLMEKADGAYFGDYCAEPEDLESGLGRLYPSVGGLSANIKKFVGEDKTIREVHGEAEAYEYFKELEQRVADGKELPYMIDCLSCKEGCLSGTATSGHDKFNDDIFFNLKKFSRQAYSIPKESNPYLPELSLEERRRLLFERFSGLDVMDFYKSYEKESYFDDRYHIDEMLENFSGLEEVFQSMGKTTPQSRVINCRACGYSSCSEMAVAIASGYNTVDNCLHYIKEKNYKASITDYKTGIGNMNAFLNLLEKLILKENVQDYATIFFNINNFNWINEKYGFKKGDEALKEYAVRLAGMTSADECVSIIGSNNFVAVVKKDNLEKIMKALEGIELFCLNDIEGGMGDDFPKISARAAVYYPTDKDSDPYAIFNKLSMTFDMFKRSYNKNVIYYSEEMQRQVLAEDALYREIEPAIKNNEFLVYYQPKVDMNTRQLIGAEALIRWNHNGEIVLPAKFIPACEQKGIVQRLDFFVLENVCKNISEWIGKGLRAVPISVNFSKYHFVDASIAEKINAVAEKYNTPRELIEIEFTETAYLDDSEWLISSINKLHGFGIASSMDDFGTGYSSLSMLQDMSFDTLKLDRSFLKENMYNDERSVAVIGSIIKMAKALNMTIVSEGIETEKELEYMRSMDCDMAQGFLFDKPLEEKEFEKRLKQEFY